MITIILFSLVILLGFYCFSLDSKIKSEAERLERITIDHDDRLMALESEKKK